MTARPEGVDLSRKPSERSASRSQEAQDDLAAKRRAAIAEKAAKIPRSRRAGYLKAAQGEASPRQAIKAFCLECVGWSQGEVTHCTGTTCPLWLYRPFRSRTD